MQLTRHLLLLLMLGLIISSCSHAPKALDESATLTDLRQDYTKKYPDAKFNPYIKRGQIVKGMKHLEVMASWGLPESRSLSHDRKLEYWTFYGKDSESWDWIRYTLEFEENFLVGWDVTRHYAKNGVLEDILTRQLDRPFLDRPRLPAADVSTLKR